MYLEVSVYVIAGVWPDRVIVLVNYVTGFELSESGLFFGIDCYEALFAGSYGWIW